MKHKRFGIKRRGFTLIEVSLFLAISGLLFIGIIAGTQNSIWSQRFFDSVQSYTEFMRSIYSQVSNPQSVGAGRADTAIYGKLVVFGESTGLDGEPVKQNEWQEIFVYDVIGDVAGADSGTGTAKKMLRELGANVVVATKYDDFGKVVEVGPAGIVQNYSPKWAASIEGVEKVDGSFAFRGSVLVVRHPRSGTINTLISPKVIEVNEMIRDFNLGGGADAEHPVWSLLSSELGSENGEGVETDPGSFKTERVDFCVNPYGLTVETEVRRNVRLVANARNASGVELIDMDSPENACRELSE